MNVPMKPAIRYTSLQQASLIDWRPITNGMIYWYTKSLTDWQSQDFGPFLPSHNSEHTNQLHGFSLATVQGFIVYLGLREVRIFFFFLICALNIWPASVVWSCNSTTAGLGQVGCVWPPAAHPRLSSGLTSAPWTQGYCRIFPRDLVLELPSETANSIAEWYW
jgi:hypothetical protein